uniref:PDZ domain-containing protein n=1 Tax=Strongyloides papillosus TaxID=174720 RepID=A0A0N5CBQ1_STREA
MLSNIKKLRKGKKKDKDKKKNEVKRRKKAHSVGSVVILNEPGSIKEMVLFQDNNKSSGYDELIEKIKEENEKMYLYSVKCNSPCNPGDLIIDKSKTVTFIFKRSPLINLLLYQDEIVHLNGKNVDVDDEECVLPVEPCQRLDLVIRRRGRSMAVPYIRQTNINLDMEYGYYYFVVNVPRMQNLPIGMEFHNTQEDGVIIHNVIRDTIAYYLFSQGDYILDINGIPINSAQEVFQMILEDQTTFPKFSCVIKRACSRPTQIKVVRTLFESPTFPLGDDLINIIKSEEKKILSNDGRKKKVRTVLKFPGSIQNSTFQTCNNISTSPINLPKKNERSKYYCISLRSNRSKISNNNVRIIDVPKTKEIGSDIDNIIFTNPVPQKTTSFEQ